MSIMKYHTYLFDLDGVLVDTHKSQYIATQMAILQLCQYNINDDPTISALCDSTITTRKKLEQLAEMNIIPKDKIEEIYTLKKYMANKIFQTIQPSQDKIDLFIHLAKRECQIGVVTNGNRESAEIILKNLKLYEMINILITNEDCTQGKPHPEPYLTAIKKLNASIDKTIIFEDSEIGIQSAKETGCDVYIVKSINDIQVGLLDNFL